MTAQAARWQILDGGQGLPITATLKSYQDNLRDLLQKSAPATVLDDSSVVRTYILDGVDEIPRDHLTTFQIDLRNLLANDTSARIILTSRQAYAAQHRDALPGGLITFHLLHFAGEDVKAYVGQQGIDPDAFLASVRTAVCEEEVRNPFVLSTMLQRYKEHGDLSPFDPTTSRTWSADSSKADTTSTRRDSGVRCACLPPCARRPHATNLPLERRSASCSGDSPIDTWQNTITYRRTRYGSNTRLRRWLDGCRHAVIILDGDVGRNLKKNGQHYTTEGKRAIQLCKPHAITLHILQRYGIENYFPQHACEAVLNRDLAAYFPIPVHKPIQEHFSERRPWWRTIFDPLQHRPHQSFC